MADVIDDAQEYNEIYQAAAFAAHAKKMRPQSHPDFDGSHCVECDCDIPPQRLSWGRIRCTECEDIQQRLNRR